MSSDSSLVSDIKKVTRNVLGGALNPIRSAKAVGRLVQRSPGKPGAAPGTLIHHGPQKMDKARIRLIEHDAEKIREVELDEVAHAFPTRDNPPVGWINIDGLHDTELLAQIRDHFDLHLLTMEDVVTLGQRAKMEEYDGYLYLAVPMLSFNHETLSVTTEQLSLILGPNWVITFQERVGDVFEPIRERLRVTTGRIRQRGSDYLAYALLDGVVDTYFDILERFGDVAEELDERVMDEPAPEVLHMVNHLKRELLLVRKAIWPLREALNSMVRTESPLVSESTQVFLRDVHDHAVQIIDTVETLRDVASSMTDLYLSSMGQRTNEVMKVLTIMASIFIPLTFMAGIYGMNFEFMPELHYRWAYPALWVAMLSVAGGMVFYFKKKNWF